MTENTPTQFGPPARNYAPEPDFKYSATPGQEEFAQLLAIGGDLVQSLISSGIAPADAEAKYPRGQLLAMACKQRQLPPVVERTGFYQLLNRLSLSIRKERIEQEYAALAFSTPVDLMNEEGSILAQDLKKLPRHTQAAIKEITIDPLKGVKVKMHDKNVALRALGELGGHFAEADQAKAPAISVNLFSEGTPKPAPRVIDCTPSTAPVPESELHPCLR